MTNPVTTRFARRAGRRVEGLAGSQGVVQQTAGGWAAWGVGRANTQ